MPRLQIDIPDDRYADVLAAVAKALEDPPARPPAETHSKWDAPLATLALPKMWAAEKRLMFRLAEAVEQRVPVSELSRDLGLPKTAAVDRDFPGLSEFCAERNLPVPVIAGGDGNDAWYWLDADTAFAFQKTLEGKV